MSQDRGGNFTDIQRWSQALSWNFALREMDERKLTNSVGREWQNWYAESENRLVFDNLSNLLGDRNLYHKRCRPSKAELETDLYDLSAPIAEWRRTQAPQGIWRQRSPSRHWWWWLSTGTGILAFTVLILIWPRLFALDRHAGRIIYQTRVGVLKDVRLPDGSNIILGGHTKLSVAFSAPRRSVSLIEGEAWFKIAHHSRWPFVVTAGDGTITDIGTAFLVTRESDRVVVTVTEGEVEVSAQPALRSSHKLDHGPLSAPDIVPMRLGRGEELALGDNGALSAIKQTDAHSAIEWTHGRLTFDNQPLRYVVEALDRYSSRHIVVSGSAGTLRFSGIVSVNEIGGWLQGLEVIFPVSVGQQGESISIRMRSAPATRAPASAQP